MADIVFKKTKGLTDLETHYCPGCTHGIIHRIIGEVLEELDILGKTIGIAPVGCSVLAYKYFNCDMQQASHGRAPAVATGVKAVLPDNIVFTYQGDGDLAAIGTAEIIHAAARGEKFVTIFVNNAIYGMTGGQLAPTSLQGQQTATSIGGIDTGRRPIKVSEMLAVLDGTYYIERVSVHDPMHIRKTKMAIKKAFKFQIEKKGFCLIEVLSTCPTNMGQTPQEGLDWIKAEMMPVYPLGIYKDFSKEV